MTDDLDPLLRDFVEWVAKQPRSYSEAMDAWRTSCPRLTVWEDATDRGLVARDSTNGRIFVKVTRTGQEFLRRRPQ
jgi:hypothetical protein